MTELLPYALADGFLRARIEQIVAEHRIEAIVETGLDKGLSAVELAKMVPRYVGIDVDEKAVTATSRLMIERGVLDGPVHHRLILGSSADILPRLKMPAATLYFLDAHCFGDTDCPIRDEIRAIPRGKGVLLFHDVFQPGREHGGFFPLIDGVETRFDYELVEDELRLWSPTHRIEYQERYPTELAPGVMFAFPK